MTHTPLGPILLSLKQAQRQLARETRAAKDAALQAVIDALNTARAAILAANEQDVAKARANGTREALVDRLALNERRLDGITASVAEIIRQEDPTGRVHDGWTLPNGLRVERHTAPLGVIAVIYESRPNVTVDAFSLAYKAGCAVLLRGSSAALKTNRTLAALIKTALAACGGQTDALALLETGERDEIDAILNARGLIDVVIPRGGKELIRRVTEGARVPVIKTGEGNCHIYLEAGFDLEKAAAIVENAKIQKPGACNAVETLLVRRDVLAAFMPLLARRLAGKAELRCDAPALAAIGAAPPGLILAAAREEDWETEYLDTILAVKTVDTLDQALAHIDRYGTAHSEAILTGSVEAAETFLRRVDAACVYVNASTRFTDGGQFGFGAELGISTQKFHARGPLGLSALTTTKYHIHGSGHIRD